MPTPFIQSADNPKIKHLSKLLSCAKSRRRHAQAVLEGTHLLEACLNAGVSPHTVFVPQARFDDAETAALLARLPENRITAVADAALRRVSSLHDGGGVAALLDVPRVPPPHSGGCLLLDRVQDPGNVGTVLRSAAAAGVDAVLLGKGCADAWSPKVLRSGMGAHFALTLCEDVDLAAWCGAYRGRVLAAALRGRRTLSLYETDLTGETAWLFGNEGAGVAAELIAAADAAVKIPMADGVESLNVAMAATVCLFEQMRQRRAA